jgi:hypothetical protein
MPAGRFEPSELPDRLLVPRGVFCSCCGLDGLEALWPVLRLLNQRWAARRRPLEVEELKQITRYAKGPAPSCGTSPPLSMRGTRNKRR